MSAKNKHNLSKFVGFTYFRKAGQNGSWLELASARATVATIDTTAQNVDVVCDTRWSVFKWTIPEAMIALTFLENANTWVLSALFWLTQTAQAAWAKTITDELNVFGNDDKIVLNHYSNDWAWVSSIVVKSSDWLTTYTLTTDYTVSVVDNETTITRVWGWTITANEAVLVSWTVNVNASESISMVSEFTLKQEFEIKIVARIEKDWKTYRRVVSLNPATLDSTYALEFLDVVKNWDINWASVEFKLSEGWAFKMYDEIITDEISG